MNLRFRKTVNVFPGAGLIQRHQTEFGHFRSINLGVQIVNNRCAWSDESRFSLLLTTTYSVSEYCLFNYSTASALR